MINHDDITRAARCAKAYRAFGFNVFPSHRDRKGPNLPTYKADEPCPVDLYDRHATGNLQLSTGVKWGLVVIDLDGPLAMAKWKEWRKGKPSPPTWTVQSESDTTRPEAGVHLYYRVPPGVDKIESRRVWGLWELPEGKWMKRAAIEIIADGKLITAPPSVHCDTGKRYAFLPGLGPKEMPEPAEMPAWMLLLPKVEPPGKNVNSYQRAQSGPPLKSFIRPSGGPMRSEDVLGLISDKIALAGSWGLRIAGGAANPKGFVKCYRAGVDEVNPSAGISEETGRYWEDGETCSLFDLGVKLGVFPDWKACKAWCEAQFTGTAQS